jgi:hypothetical protein
VLTCGQQAEGLDWSWRPSLALPLYRWYHCGWRIGKWKCTVTLGVFPLHAHEFSERESGNWGGAGVAGMG